MLSDNDPRPLRDSSNLRVLTNDTSLEDRLNGLSLSDKIATSRKNPRRSIDSKRKYHSASVSYSAFEHSGITKFPKIPEDFFIKCDEVAMYQNGDFYLKSSQKKPAYPCLQTCVALIAENRSNRNRTPHLGCDLYEGHEGFKPLSSAELDSSYGCFSYIKSWERRKHKHYGKNQITIISPRHHIVNLIMAPFDDDEVSIICTNLGNGRLLFSEDKTKRKKSGLDSKNLMTRKICYSGFALEKKLTTPHDQNIGPLYSIVEGKLDCRITMLLRCEMDAYNPILDCYTELKCFAKLNVQNTAHRRKLLKTWIQIALVPSSDLIIGTRDPQVGQLSSLTWFSKNSLYRSFNNSDVIRHDKYLNFNANIAVEWYHHCIQSICYLVMDKSKVPSAASFSPESFKIVIERSRNISVKKLTKVPSHVQIPKDYRET